MVSNFRKNIKTNLKLFLIHIINVFIKLDTATEPEKSRSGGVEIGCRTSVYRSDQLIRLRENTWLRNSFLWLLWSIKFITRHLEKIQADCLQSTLVEYWDSFGFINRNNEIPCCLLINGCYFWWCHLDEEEFVQGSRLQFLGVHRF